MPVRYFYRKADSPKHNSLLLIKLFENTEIFAMAKSYLLNAWGGDVGKRSMVRDEWDCLQMSNRELAM